MEERIFSVIRNLCEYRNYKGDSTKAAKALRRQLPQLERDACLRIIDHFSLLYDRIDKKIDSDRELALRIYKEGKGKEWIMENIVVGGLAQAPEVDEKKIANWIFNFLIDWKIIR